MTSHILSWIIFTPLMGAFALLFVPKSASHLIKWIALATTAVVLGFVCYAMTFFQAGHAGFQMIERAPWIPSFNVQYLIGTDGISFPMVLLTAIISLLACLASGGIKGLDDIRALLALKRRNLYGVITGRAVYEGTLDIREALKLC